MKSETRVLILTGHSGCGKTTVCARVIALAEAEGVSRGGILTLPRPVGGETLGLDVQDVANGRTRPLGETAGETGGPSVGRFRFHSESVHWGNEVLLRARDCALLVVDEVGPLELLDGEGWTVAFDVLRTGTYRLALVVVRPGLVDRFRDELGGPHATTVPVTLDNRDALPRRIAVMLPRSG